MGSVDGSIGLIVLAFILAIILDLLIIRAWRRYRRVRRDDWSFREKVRAWVGLPEGEAGDREPKGGVFFGFRDKTKQFFNKKASKVLIFFISVGFVVYGQYLMSRFVPIEALLQISQRINNRFRIDVNNLDNVIVGVLFIVFGGVMFAFSTRDIIIRRKFTESDQKKEQINLSKTSPSKTWVVVGAAALVFLLIRLVFFHAAVFDTVAWIISFVAFLYAAFWLDRSADVSLRIQLHSSEIIQLLLIFTLGLFIGVYQLQDVPNSLMGDEGNFFETARSIALGIYRPSPFDLGVYSYSIFSSYWQALILKIFGIGLWSWRFASVLPSILTVFPLYLLSRDLFGRVVAVVSCLVLIVSPYLLTFSRLGYNNSQSILVVTLCVWLVYYGAARRSVFYSFLGGVGAGLGFLTYTAGRLGIVIACVYFAFLILKKSSKTRKKQYLLNAVVPFLIGWIVIAIPHLIYQQQNTPQSSRIKMVEGLFFTVSYGQDYYPVSDLFSYAPPIEFDQQEFFYNPEIYRELLFRGVARSLLVFHHKDMISEHNISNTLAGPLATIFYTLGVFLVCGRSCDWRFLLIVIWFASGLFFLSIVSTYPPRHQHLVPVIPAISIIIALGVVAFSKKITVFMPPDNNKKQVVQYGLVVLIVISIGVLGLREFFIVMPKMYRPNLEQVINWFGLHNSPEVDFILINSENLDQEWRPYLFRELLTEHKFTLITENEFWESESDPGVGSDIAIFYEPEIAGQITQRLVRIIPNAKEISFQNRDQKLIGKAIIQGDVVIPYQASFLEGVIEIFTSPIIWVLIPLLLFICIYWIKQQQNRSIFLEFGIYLRFGSGSTVHHIEPKIKIPSKPECNDHNQDG